MGVRQKSCRHGYIELVETCTGHATILAVLPNNLSLFIHEDNAIVRAAIYRVRAARQRRSYAPWNAGPGNKGELAHTLRVICADDRKRSRFVRSVSEGPDDIVSLWIDFNDSVIKLISDNNVSFFIESVLRSCLRRVSGRKEDASKQNCGSHASEPDELLNFCICIVEFRHRHPSWLF